LTVFLDAKTLQPGAELMQEEAKKCRERRMINQCSDQVQREREIRRHKVENILFQKI